MQSSRPPPGPKGSRPPRGRGRSGPGPTGGGYGGGRRQDDRRDRSRSPYRRDRSRSPYRSARNRDRSRSPYRPSGRPDPRGRSPPRGSRAPGKDSRDGKTGAVAGAAHASQVPLPDENADPEEYMKQVMGFGNFRSTKNTKVPGNDKNYGVRIDKETRYRQYMNRTKGFNRPLSPVRPRRKGETT